MSKTVIKRPRKPSSDPVANHLILKDAQVMMAAPLFSLSTKKDTSTYSWDMHTREGTEHVEVTANAKTGRANLHDKLILIYCASILVRDKEQGALHGDGRESDRKIQFMLSNFLKWAKRVNGTTERKKAKDSIRRLQGTTIETDIATGGERTQKQFSLINFQFQEPSGKLIGGNDSSTHDVRVEIEVSPWLFRAMTSYGEVLSVEEAYLTLRKPIVKRLWEIAQKYARGKAEGNEFRIGVGKLQLQCGSVTARRSNWIATLNEVAHEIPGFTLSLEEGRDDLLVRFKEAA